MTLNEFLMSLDLWLDDLQVDSTEQMTEDLEELIPELKTLCQHAWLLELIVKICRSR